MQNKSHAVMNQRHEPSTSSDYFGTPAHATRALLAYLNLDKNLSVCDPACGYGHMLRPLSEHFTTVSGADIHNYGYGDVRDFLSDGLMYSTDWIFTNPPFNLALDFVLKGLQVAKKGVAVLVRTNFAETTGRYNKLFSQHRPKYRLQFVNRVVMHKGHPPDPDIPQQKWDKTKGKFVYRKPTTATSYEWMVWTKEIPDYTIADWLSYDRKDLTKAGDYSIPQPYLK